MDRICQHYSFCSGCSFSSQSESLAAKLSQAQQILEFKPILVLSSGPHFTRSRTDLYWDHGKLGFKDRQTFTVIDWQECLQLVPDLWQALQLLKQILGNFPAFGSIRVRISPSGLLGVWFDFSNADIKQLLLSEEICKKLLENFVVEMGQRRKQMLWNGEQNRFSLAEPKAYEWIETETSSGRFGLLSYIGSFTQPGFKNHGLLIQQLQSWISSSAEHKNILEYGCGIGNLTILLLDRPSVHVTVIENDRLALACLNLNLNKFKSSDVRISPTVDAKLFTDLDLILADPARPGLDEKFKSVFTAAEKPKQFILISCSWLGLKKDCDFLRSCGYQLNQAYLLDQFPLTEHAEVLTNWII